MIQNDFALALSHFLQNRLQTFLKFTAILRSGYQVKVSGGNVYIGQYLNKALVSAEDVAKQMGDEYVSVEHLFLSLLNHPSPSMKQFWKG